MSDLSEEQVRALIAERWERQDGWEKSYESAWVDEFESQIEALAPGWRVEADWDEDLSREFMVVVGWKVRRL